MKILTFVIASVSIATSSALNLLQLAESQPSLSSFLLYVNASGLNNTLSASGSLTVFAPDDAAFDNVTMPNSSDQIAEIIQSHLVEGNLSLAMLNGSLSSLNGESLDVLTSTSMPSSAAGASNTSSKLVNGANILEPDLYADNGILMIIDKVLIPGGGNIAEEEATEPETPEQEPEPSTPSEEREPDQDQGGTSDQQPSDNGSASDHDQGDPEDASDQGNINGRTGITNQTDQGGDQEPSHQDRGTDTDPVAAADNTPASNITQTTLSPAANASQSTPESNGLPTSTSMPSLNSQESSIPGSPVPSTRYPIPSENSVGQ